jgi:hypothetical protein
MSTPEDEEKADSATAEAKADDSAPATSVGDVVGEEKPKRKSSSKKKKKKRRSKLDPDGIHVDNSVYDSTKSLKSTVSNGNEDNQEEEKPSSLDDPEAIEAGKAMVPKGIPELDEEESGKDSSDSGSDTPLATIPELFSFAESTKSKVYIAIGVFFSVISGVALPGSVYYFSAILGDIAAIAEEGLDPVVDLVYAMMVLGCISLVSNTLQGKFLTMT